MYKDFAVLVVWGEWGRCLAFSLFESRTWNAKPQSFNDIRLRCDYGTFAIHVPGKERHRRTSHGILLLFCFSYSDLIQNKVEEVLILTENIGLGRNQFKKKSLYISLADSPEVLYKIVFGLDLTLASFSGFCVMFINDVPVTDQPQQQNGLQWTTGPLHG